MLISASKANKKTNEIMDNRISKEFQEISEQINEPIQAGCFSITRGGCLHSTIREKLEKLGYKVSIGSQYNESYYSISWQ